MDYLGFLGDGVDFNSNPIGARVHTLSEYLRVLITDHSREGVFGFKLRLRDVAVIRRLAQAEFGLDTHGDIRALLPLTRYVLIERGSPLEQAVSLWRARKTNVWSRCEGEPPQPQPTYDWDEITRALDEVLRERFLLAQFCDRLAAAPYPVDYEDLCIDPALVVRKFISSFSLDGAADFRPGARALKLGDRFTAEVIARWRQDAENRNLLA